jgi:hypothetical protein
VERSQRPAPRFLETEATLGCPVEHPLRLFKLDDLGIEFERLQHVVASSFRELPWDEYDARRQRVEVLKAAYPEHAQGLDDFLPAYFAGESDLDQVEPLINALSEDDHARFEQIHPFRRRALASFVVRRASAGIDAWEIEREADAPFTQSKDHDRDYRCIERYFAPSPTEVTQAPEYLAVIRSLAALTNEVRGGSLRAMKIICHQMSLVIPPSGTVTNAPEGIHQDGADYIVSALVIERRNVTGGESIVYGSDKRTEYLRHTLMEGEGIYQADVGSPFWHWVTPVHPADPDPPDEPVRSILGYDIQLT